MTRHFSEEDIWRRYTDGKQAMKVCWISLAISEMPVKTPKRYYCTPIRKANTRSSDKATCWRRWRKWITHTLLTGICNDTATLGNNLAISPRPKHATSIWPSPRTPGRLSFQHENYVHTKTVHKCFRGPFFGIAPIGNQPGVLQGVNGETAAHPWH